jgi:hypothetical protein
VAIEVRFEFCQLSERARINDLLERDEIRIPASVLVNGEFLAGLFGDFAELACFSSCRDERLLDDDVLAGFESGLAHAIVGFGDAGDDYDVYIGVLQGFVDAAVGFGAGVVLLCVVGGFGRALDDSVDLVDGGEGEY